jgi:putative ABC transport system substrate-binding protein
MKRRDFLRLFGSVAVASPIFWPHVADAQQAGKVWRIGWLSGLSRPAILESSQFAGFTQGMRELGYVEGRDFIIEWRFAESRPDRYDELAVDLAQQKIDLYVAGAPQVVRPLQRAAPNAPIVVAISADPVGQGFAQSLAHPGGNITGIANSIDDTAPKQLEILLAAVPGLNRLGVLGNSAGPNVTLVKRNLDAAAQAAKIELVAADARNEDEIVRAFSFLERERVQAVMVISDVLFNLHRNRVGELAIKIRLPSMFSIREYVEAGGLMSYGESFREFFRRSASFVDKIIKGAKPGDLPFEQPNRFFFVVNLKAAKAIGLDMPTSLVLRADEVIE